MRNLNLKVWEVILIFLSVLLFSVSFVIYLSDFPLRKYLFRLDEEEGQVLIGQVATKVGSLKRQLSNDAEFRSLEEQGSLYNMDILVTGPESGATLKFDGGGSVEMGPSTMIRLAFQSNLSLEGINRYGKLNVVAGKVTGQAATNRKLIISSNEGETVVKPNSYHTIVVKDTPVRKSTTPLTTPVSTKVTSLAPPVSAPSPRPLAVLIPSPTPSPSPSPNLILTTAQAEKVKIIFPKNADLLEVDSLLPRPGRNVKFMWKMSPPSGKTLVTLWHLIETHADGTPVKEQIFSRVFSAREGQGMTVWKLHKPGTYEWEIKGPHGEAITSENNSRAKFTIRPEFEGIKILAPLVGGRNSVSNKLDGNLLKSFEITLRWEKYAAADDYRIIFLSSPNSKTPILQRTLKATEFIFNKDKIFSGQIYYRVTTALESGFVAHSGLQKFSFSFLPPVQVIPENNQVISLISLIQEGYRVLFTWQKTNFTEGYELEIANDASFKQIYLKKNSKENYFILKKPPAGKYWWRVRSFSKGLSSPMSAPFKFQIQR
jgi:hypothetical protein